MPARFRVVLGSMMLMAVTIGHRPPVLAQGQPAIERIAPDIMFGRILSAELGADGRICVADDLEVKVTCLSPDGVLLWTYGRRGGGPGEFRGIYRLAIAPDLTVLVFDFQTGELHRLSAAGVHLGKARFPTGFSQMNSLVAISHDTFAVSGTLWQPGTARDAAIHLFVFRDSIEYLRSFGDRPAAVDRQKVDMLGTGPITLTAGGTLLYSQRFPYAVVEYTLTGRKLRSVTNAMRTRSPDEQMSIERSGSRIAFRAEPPRAGTNIVTTARDVGDGRWWVARHVAEGRQYVDIVDPRSGRWEAPIGYPAWDAVIGIFGEDRKRGSFVASTECDDEPCLIRFSTRAILGGPSLRAP